MGTQIIEGGWKSSPGSLPESLGHYRFALRDDGVPTAGSHRPNAVQGDLRHTNTDYIVCQGTFHSVEGLREGFISWVVLGGPPRQAIPNPRWVDLLTELAEHPILETQRKSWYQNSART